MAKIAYKNIAVGNEPSFGASDTIGKYIHVTSLDLRPNENKELLDDTSGSPLGHTRFHKKRLEVTGNWEMYAYPDGIKESLEMVTGSTPTGTSVGASATEYTFVANKNDYRSKWFRVDDGVRGEDFHGLRAKTWELSVSDNATITQELIGKDYQAGTSITQVSTTVQPFTLGEFKVYYANSYADIGSSTMTEIAANNFTVTYDNQLEGMHQSGSRSIRRSDPETPTLEVSWQQFYESATLTDTLNGCTVVALRIEADSTQCQGYIAGVTPYRIVIDIPEAQLIGTDEREYQAGSKIMATYTLHGAYNSAQDALWIPKLISDN